MIREMETKELRLIENVQALASKNLEEIPPIYLRPEVEHDQVSVEESLEIPVIDMSKLLDQNPPVHHDELTKLHLACKDWGFFQLINHGVPEEVVEKMKIDIEGFYQLPLEEKKACAQLPNNIEGYGQPTVYSEDQKLDWSDRLFLFPRPVSIRNLRFWPTNPPSFRENLDKYSSEVEQVTNCLFNFMSKNLGLNPETLSSIFEGGRQIASMNFYPPCKQANKVLGITPHSDAAGLNMLLQVNDVQGLQIKRSGKWVPVEPIPGAFIVNIGDILEIMSNGEYKSIEHRGVVNPEKHRISMSAYRNPHIKSMIGPLPELVKESKAKYKTMNNEDYTRFILSSKIKGKNRVTDLMKIDQ